jgi:antibiotic biosynthesis monooxygenase (ABM) superfamily enzyme
MIIRYWRAWTAPKNADAFEGILRRTVFPGIAARDLPGYHGAYLLRRETGCEVEFATLMLFESIDDVRAFVGGDYEAAVVTPAAREAVSRFDERALHFDLLLTPEQTSGTR